MTTVVQTFADWAVDFGRQPTPREVQHHAKRALVDWTAALYAGAQMPPATLL